MRRFLCFGAVLALAGPAAAGPPPARTLDDATTVLTELQKLPRGGIPANLMADAQGVVVIPRVVKAGFIVGGRGGHGVALAKTPDGAWAEPVFVNIGGASIGFQAGVQATDLVLVFRNRKALERILDGKGKLTLGADAGIAAGPVGRRAEAATDARLKSEILSYSRSRGLFAGVSLDGAVLAGDATANREYRDDPRAAAKGLDALLTKITEMSKDDAPPPAAGRPDLPPGAAPGTVPPVRPAPPVTVPDDIQPPPGVKP